MLKCVACACLRNWRKTQTRRFNSVYTVRNLSSVQNTFKWLANYLLTDARISVARHLSVPAGSAKDYVLASSTAQKDSEESDLHGSDFGTLSNISSRRSFRKSSPEIQNIRYDDDEDDLDKPLFSGRRNTPYWYFLQCKKLIRDNKLQEALDLFNRNMLKGERLQPQEYNYTILIGGCGRAGHLKKAFKLYNDMKKRGIDPTDATYTALFNACAETPWKQTGLQQALHLEQELRRNNYPLSSMTYHALLKTHAMTNHLQACLHTFKEMLQNGHAVTQETFHYLLMGCLKDKETGFRLALQVWRQMLRSGIDPDSKNYNLLLRTARDCGIGDPSLATQILLSFDGADMKNLHSKSGCNPVDVDHLERQLFIQPSHQNKSDSSEDRHEGKEEVSHDRDDTSHLVVFMETPNVSSSSQLEPCGEPLNLLDFFVRKKESVISLGTINSASDRLSLIGGAKGFLKKMTVNGLCPDLKTLTLLADTMETGSQSLEMLLQVAKQYRVKLDVAFFNSVIRRAVKAGDLDGAKAVLRVMRQRNVSVDVQTYGSLALGCDRQKDGLQLLKDMEEARLRPNVHVFSALIGRAARRLDYIYLKTLLQSMADMEVWPNEVIIKQLEFAAQYPPNYDQYKTRNNYLIQINGFRGYYQQWLRSMPAQGAEADQPNPQTETEEAPKETGALSDELSANQRNMLAAARRYNSKKNKQGSTKPLM